jgi:HJR/Mrr/RecB family endonuclease
LEVAAARQAFALYRARCEPKNEREGYRLGVTFCMATHFSCPHCGATLLVPEESGGRTTRCPQCSQSFVIPGSPGPVPATPVCAVPASAEAEFNEADRRRTQEAFERLSAESVGLQVELARRQGVRRRLAMRLVWLERFRSGRQKLDETIGRAGGFFVTLALAAAVAMVLASLFSPSAFGFFAAAVLGACAAGAIYLPFSFVPDDAKLALLIPRTQARLAEAERLHETLASDQARQREQLLLAEEAYRRVQAALDSRVAWLRSCQWQQMSGKSFVNFLRMVFEEHGYTIEPTGKKGQVGIDLVVVKGGTRVAVVAKGTQLESVDNRIIEQAQSGKQWYDCPTAVVVTNVPVLPSARQLAERNGCRIVDAGQISDLIEGRLRV